MQQSLKLINPSKFLTPYGRDDHRSFPKRDDVLQRLHSLFKRTSFLVLHGPHGAGKTSLVNCAFVKKIGVSQRATFYMRREDDFLQAFREQLEQKDLDVKISNHIQEYIETKEKWLRNNTLFDDCNNMILWYETGNQRFKDKVKSDFRQGIKISELKSKRDDIDRTDTDVIKWEKQLISDFKELFTELKTSPLLIFDQFEEIFIHGSPDERSQFGILCEFLLNNSAPVNSVVIIDEDYFGHLDEFTQYVPRIFYNSVRLLDPDKHEARNIIHALCKDHGRVDEQTGGSQIVDHLLAKLFLNKAATPIESDNQRLHLPYLQIYLKAHQDKYGDVLSLQSIESLGDINSALEQFLRALNDRIFKGLGLSSQGHPKEYPVIRFLKYFVSSLNHRAQKVSAKDLSSLNVSYAGRRRELSMTMLSDLLLQEGILEKRGEYYELGHASLAGPVSNFTIREDLLKKDFETSFQLWNQPKLAEEKSGESEGFLSLVKQFAGFSSPDNLLSRAQVFAMESYKDYILTGDRAELAAKKEFWSKSRKNERKWRRRRNIILIVFAVLATGFGALSFVAKEQAQKALAAEEENFRLQKAGEVTTEVYKGTGEAWKNYKNDRTSAFNQIQGSRLEYRKGDPEVLKSTNTPLPDLVAEFENTFYNDFNTYPFYFKDIKLPDNSGYVIETKTCESDDSLFIIALTTKGNLYIYRQNWLNKQGKAVCVSELHDVKTFEPFKVDDELKVLAVTPKNSSSLAILQVSLAKENMGKIDTLRPGKRPAENTSEYIASLQQMRNNRFILGMGKSLWDLVIGLGDDSKEYAFGFRQSMKGEVREIRKLGTDHFVVLFGRSGLYNSGLDSIIKQSNRSTPDLPSDLIYTVAYDHKEGQLLLGYNNGIVYRCDLYGRNAEKLDFRHREAIRSIAIDDDRILVGSLDKTASIWIDGNQDKNIIGHTDPIYTVSFLEDSNYMISSGEDGHIKLWDLSPTHDLETAIPGTEIRKLQFNEKTGALLIAHRVRSGKTSGDLGKIYRYDLGLNRIGFYTQNLRLADSTDHVLAFDYYADSVLVLAGGKNHLVTTAKELPDLEIRLTDITAAIHDIEIVGTVIYLATSHGILYSTLGNATGIYDTLDETSEHRVNSLDYSKEANLLVSGFDDSRIILFKPDTTGMPPRIDTILVNHNDKVADVEFSASGKYLASGGWDNKVIIWERDQEEWRVHGTHPHNNDVLDVQFYNDSLLLSASVDRTVQLYKDSLEQFVRIPSLISHTSAITAATFANTDDGLYVISGDRSGRLRKWNIEAFDHLMKSRTYNEIAGAEANFEASKRFRCTTWKLETKSNEVPETIEFSASDSEFETDFVWWKRWRRVLGVKSPWGKGKYEILDSGKIEFQTGQPEDSIRTFTYQIHNDTLLTDSTTLIIGSAALILTEESGKEVRYRRKR